MDNVDNSQPTEAKQQILGVFAKQPIPGQVKTRLCPPLSAGQAAQVYTASLLETVMRLRSDEDYHLAICYVGERRWFQEKFPDILLFEQQGDGLGARMADRLSDWLQSGYERAVLIGSDTPDLPQQRIAQAFAALRQVDVVHGPAIDGGYYLVGESAHQPQLFSQISWSTSRVLKQTLHQAQQLGISCACLEPWDDLDDYAALLHLLQRSPLSQTAAQIRTVLKCLSDTCRSTLT